MVEVGGRQKRQWQRWPQWKMGEGGGETHDNRGAKEEVRRWRMLMMMMMVVVGHDDG